MYGITFQLASGPKPPFDLRLHHKAELKDLDGIQAAVFRGKFRGGRALSRTDFFMRYVLLTLRNGDDYNEADCANLSIWLHYSLLALVEGEGEEEV
jgi:hypothetical protein